MLTHLHTRGNDVVLLFRLSCFWMGWNSRFQPLSIFPCEFLQDENHSTAVNIRSWLYEVRQCLIPFCVCFFRRIAGLNEKKAKEIVAWRQRNGGFSNREQLKKVRGIGEKTFEQCVGFLRILGPFIETIVIDSDEDAGLKSEPGQFSGKRKAEGSGVVNKKRKHDNPVGYNRLDSTCIHPESYPVAERQVYTLLWLDSRLLGGDRGGSGYWNGNRDLSYPPVQQIHLEWESFFSIFFGQ